MKRNHSAIELEIYLDNTKPLVWRRLLVPSNITFKKLHSIFQIAMGWESAHLFDFEVDGEKYTDNSNDGWMMVPAKSLNCRIDKAVEGVSKFKYTYDFGDNWVHTVKVLSNTSNLDKLKLPVCLAGENACPPEDCGGVWGYENFKEGIEDKNHEQHEEFIEWIGEEFRPHNFDLAAINQELH